MKQKKYPTPLGELLTLTQISNQDRIVCSGCGFAVLQDEFIPCADCDNTCWCLYCWQDNGWKCTTCGLVHEAMRPEPETEKEGER
jgi:hypothetical protein